MAEILLTIGIPTYKRAKLLDICLGNLLIQITNDIKSRIEIIVSDNDSPDETGEVVNKYINQGYPIQYYKNLENIGADKNISSCFFKAIGKYVWVFSDDDFILPNCLRKIYDLLDNGEFGNVYISTTSFTGDYKGEVDTTKAIDYLIYQDPIKFVDKVNYWSTFLTGNIVNKSLLKNYEYISEFYSSLLVQLSWVLPSIFAGKPNVFVNSQLVACLANNSGGYKLYEVFGTNYNWVLNQLINKKLIKKEVKRITNKHLIKSFFPMFLQTSMVKTDGGLKIMVPIYWSYAFFWINVFPTLLMQKIKGRDV